jgi:hypothetical protein
LYWRARSCKRGCEAFLQSNPHDSLRPTSILRSMQPNITQHIPDYGTPMEGKNTRQTYIAEYVRYTLRATSENYLLVLSHSQHTHFLIRPLLEILAEKQLEPILEPRNMASACYALPGDWDVFPSWCYCIRVPPRSKLASRSRRQGGVKNAFP